jgi:hypothetical protein
MTGRKLLLVGEMMVDVTVQTATEATKVRMGGVFHAARAAWACGANYEIAYFSPEYLDKEIGGMAKAHGASRATKLGNILGCPNVMLIAEATEAGSQGYEHLLSEHIEFSFDATALGELVDANTDVVVLSGNYPLRSVLECLVKSGARIHLDIGNGPSHLQTLKSLAKPIASLFLSTSASDFNELAKDLPRSIQTLSGKVAEKIILKENRGGARLFMATEDILVGAQRRQISHSVGVGDVFDTVFVMLGTRFDMKAALTYAAWIAADYAATTFPADFKSDVERTLLVPANEIVGLGGVSLPWEARPGCQIYIAAPDFDYIDRRPIDLLVECMKYHNFSPRLPVRENGQANGEMTPEEKTRLFDADMTLLGNCEVMVAVNLHDDPGMLIEIGLAHAKGIPVVVYDPFERAENVMLVNVPVLVSSSLDRVITAIFDAVAKQGVQK